MVFSRRDEAKVAGGSINEPGISGFDGRANTAHKMQVAGWG
jgi:hypothetical protein